MSWEGHPNHRWAKMYRGKRYRVNCDELNVPRTKEESRQAANEWWRKTLLTLQTKQVDEEQARYLDELAAKIDYAANNAPELLSHLKRVKEQAEEARPDMLPLEDEAEIDARLAAARLLGIKVPDNLDPVALQSLFGSGHIWPERLAKHSKTETNKTVGHQLDVFLEEMRTQQKPKTHLELSAYLIRTLGTAIWASETSVESVDEQTVARHYNWLVQQKFSPGRHNKVLGFFRRFVKWRYANEVGSPATVASAGGSVRVEPIFRAWRFGGSPQEQRGHPVLHPARRMEPGPQVFEKPWKVNNYVTETEPRRFKIGGGGPFGPGPVRMIPHLHGLATNRPSVRPSSRPAPSATRPPVLPDHPARRIIQARLTVT